MTKYIICTLFLAGVVYGQTSLQTTSRCPCSLFAGDPIRKTSGADKSVELGTRFTSDVNTNIIAVRVYQMPNEKVSSVTVWSPAGQVLSTGTTAGGSPGWNMVNLPAPLPILGGQIYTVSYHADNGFEALDQNFTWPVNNGILHALGGVYNYTAGSNFPLKTNNTNYYADVVVGPYIQLDWNPSPHPNVLYNVYRSTTSDFDFSRPIASGLPVTTYSDLNVSGGQTYFWAVTATLQSTPATTTATLP